MIYAFTIILDYYENSRAILNRDREDHEKKNHDR